MSRQLRLDLQREPDRSRASFIVSQSNQDAVTLLDSPHLWGGGVLAVVGPTGSGKTHLVSGWADRDRAMIFDPGAPLEPQFEIAARRPVLWDDADRLSAGDETLFHLINIAGRGGRLVLTGREPPRAWPATLPDLRSRLRGVTVATLEEPDDVILGGLLAKLFRERNIRPTDDVRPYLLRRMPRSGAAAADLVARLDAENRPVTRALARQVLGVVEEEED